MILSKCEEVVGIGHSLSSLVCGKVFSTNIGMSSRVKPRAERPLGTFSRFISSHRYSDRHSPAYLVLILLVLTPVKKCCNIYNSIPHPYIQIDQIIDII